MTPTPTPETDAFINRMFHDREHELTELYNFTMGLERENAELLEALENIMPYIEGDTKVPWKPALAAIAKSKGKL